MKFILSLGLLGISFIEAKAQTVPMDPGSLLGPESIALGGATVSSQLNHDSQFQNPASAAFKNQYAVSVGYLSSGDSLTASVVDTKSGPIGGGVFYIRREIDGLALDNLALGSRARVDSIAGGSLMGKLSSDFSVGASVKYMNQVLSETQEKFTQWNFDFGAKYQSGPFGLGLVFQNMMKNKSAIAASKISLGAEYAVSSKITILGALNKIKDESALGMNYLSTNLYSWSAGGEFKVNQNLSIRAGYLSNDPYVQKIVSAGIGYNTNKFGINYAFQNEIEQQFNSHNVVFTGYF